MFFPPVFDTASITKLFTAVAVRQQVSAGLSEITWQVRVLPVLIVVMGVIVALLTQRRRSQE